MKQNISVLRRSRSLVLATVGIAFFLFMTLFMRQSLLFQGELIEEIDLANKLPVPATAVALKQPAARRRRGGGRPRRYLRRRRPDRPNPRRHRARPPRWNSKWPS